MAITGDPPFGRGQTAGVTGATDADHLVGRDYWFPDVNWNATTLVKPLRSNRWVKVRAVRNSSGITLVPKRLAMLASHGIASTTLFVGTAGTAATGQVVGYCRDHRVPSYPIDEFLPSAGVVANDIFYIVLQGPCIVKAPSTAMTADVTAGDFVTALTGATSAITAGTTTGAGWLNSYDSSTNATTVASVLAILGRALSAMTSQGTTQDVLIDVGGGLFTR